MVLEEKPSLKVKIAQSFRVTAEMLSGTSVTLSRVKGKDPAMLLSYQVHAQPHLTKGRELELNYIPPPTFGFCREKSPKTRCVGKNQVTTHP